MSSHTIPLQISLLAPSTQLTRTSTSPNQVALVTGGTSEIGRQTASRSRMRCLRRNRRAKSQTRTQSHPRNRGPKQRRRAELSSRPRFPGERPEPRRGVRGPPRQTRCAGQQRRNVWIGEPKPRTASKPPSPSTISLRSSSPANWSICSSERPRSGRHDDLRTARTRHHRLFGDLGRENEYDDMEAYAQSKLANVLFTREIARATPRNRRDRECRQPRLRSGDGVYPRSLDSRTTHLGPVSRPSPCRSPRASRRARRRLSRPRHHPRWPT